jgi:hypothetical protein
MPQIGADVLMHDISCEVSQIRHKLITSGLLQATEFDSHKSFIEPHLTGKYYKQFHEKTGNRASEVSFGEFINNNPPYQNPAIVIPTNPDGNLNINHRFFIEELPTMTMLYRLGSTLGMEPEAIRLTLEFNQQLCGREYLAPEGELGKDAPDYLRNLRSPQDFARFYNVSSKVNEPA